MVGNALFASLHQNNTSLAHKFNFLIHMIFIPAELWIEIASNANATHIFPNYHIIIRVDLQLNKKSLEFSRLTTVNL